MLLFRYSLFMLLIASITLFGGIAAPVNAPRIVERVNNVLCELETSEPPNLRIVVTAEDSGGAFIETKLLRAHYDDAPQDGVQDFFLIVMPSKSPKTGIEGVVIKRTRWMQCTRDAPWLKGVRIHGANGSVEEILPLK